jgi:nucleoside-diphosphate-sugar epimerase
VTCVAVTGITGTIGLALGDLLECDDRVRTVVGIARRPFDPRSRGWTKTRFHPSDIRDGDVLRAAFEGADAVIHLAFSLTGTRQSRRELEDINVGGSQRAFAAARAAGVKRFVLASSAAAYGIEAHDLPITEDTPIKPDPRHFYVQQKVQIERILRAAAAEPGAPELVVLRPVGVAGPNAVTSSSRTWSPKARSALKFAFGTGLRPPVPPPPVRMQFLHQADAASAFLRAALDGPPGTFNVAPEDVLEPPEIVRELGLHVLPAPLRLRASALDALAHLPVPIPAWNWLQLLRVPYLLDITAARERLGWQPRYSSRQALAATRAGWSA